MKRIIKDMLLLLALTMLAACGTDRTTPEYTDEEMFLQRAYWYLQSEEKQWLTWENGTLEQGYCSDVSRFVIGPSGETDIQGITLTRVKYIYAETPWIQEINLFFDGTVFVGTDWDTELSTGDYTAHVLPDWGGDISYWLFINSPEVSTGGDLTITCVLRNNSNRTRTLGAGAPKIMEVAYTQNGKWIDGGIDAGAQNITLKPGEVYIETHTAENAYYFDGMNELKPGPYTILTKVVLDDGGLDRDGVWFSMTHIGTFTIME